MADRSRICRGCDQNRAVAVIRMKDLGVAPTAPALTRSRFFIASARRPVRASPNRAISAVRTSRIADSPDRVDIYRLLHSIGCCSTKCSDEPAMVTTRQSRDYRPSGRGDGANRICGWVQEARSSNVRKCRSTNRSGRKSD
jgi:hypothetical protein